MSTIMSVELFDSLSVEKLKWEKTRMNLSISSEALDRPTDKIFIEKIRGICTQKIGPLS